MNYEIRELREFYKKEKSIFNLAGSFPRQPSTDNFLFPPYLAPFYGRTITGRTIYLTSGLNCFCFLIVLPVIVLPQFYCKILLSFEVRYSKFDVQVLSHLLFLSVGCRCSLPMRRSTFGVRRLPAVALAKAGWMFDVQSF